MDIGTTMSVEQIGPAEAQALLANTASNRRLRQGRIDQYARDMKAGRWSSSVLRFDPEGNLVDGQHRLWAIITSETAQPFYVERGVTAISTIDSGMARTAGDVLAINGEASAITLASAVRFARWFEEYPGLAPSGNSHSPFSPDEIVEHLDANPGLRDAIRWSKATFQKGLPSYTSGSLAAALYYLTSQIAPDTAKEFWEQLTSGADLKANSATYALRQLIIADRLKPANERMLTNELAAVTIKAWNFWQYGREVRRLRWLRGNVVQEPFPRLGVAPE